jgi:hypothetical protein
MRLKRKLYQDKLEFEYFINVTSEGLFTAYLPEDVVEKLESSGIDVGYGRGRRKGYFEAHALKDIEEQIKKATEKYSEKKLKSTKIVLRYEIITTCSYCKTKKGEIVPNGGWEQRLNKSRDYNWINGTKDMDNCYSEPFGFRVYVEPQRLNVYIFPDKTEHKEYVSLEDDEIKDESTLDWLNSISSISADDDNNIKDIDYSEEVGLFFKNIILYICNLNEKLKKLFGEKMEISKKSLPLLIKL